MTETSPGITTSPAQGWKDGSAGVANPMTHVKVVDIQTGAILGPNQEGEICCLGPQNMKGYLNNDKATRQTVDPDGWLHTGELPGGTVRFESLFVFTNTKISNVGNDAKFVFLYICSFLSYLHHIMLINVK